MISENKKKSLYARIEDNAVKRTIGKLLKVLPETDAAYLVQCAVLMPFKTRRFDRETLSRLNGARDKKMVNKTLADSLNKVRKRQKMLKR